MAPGRSALTRPAASGALGDMLRHMTGGRASPTTVAYPAHWHKAQVDELRRVLGQPVISDDAATISALQASFGLPAHGIIALCDFGGTGTSITLLDASRGYAPLGATVRHTGFAGDVIDRALQRHAAAFLPAVSVQGCRAAKEQLSAATVATLTADRPGVRGDIRLTRGELDELIRASLLDVVRALQDTLDRHGVPPGALVAVASAGGGAAIPLVTTTLSERFRVPVITTPRPELAAATGAALRAARRAAFADADAFSGTFCALAWSEAHDVPPLARPKAPTSASHVRPRLHFAAAVAPVTHEVPWYRRVSALVGIGASAILLLATCAVVAFGGHNTAVSSTSPDDPAPRTVYVVPPPLPKPPHNP